jgi:hypothetical protein
MMNVSRQRAGVPLDAEDRQSLIDDLDTGKLLMNMFRQRARRPDTEDRQSLIDDLDTGKLLMNMSRQRARRPDTEDR